MTDGTEQHPGLPDLVVAYAEKEGLIGSVSEEEFARIAKAFMAGYFHGLHGNAEPMETASDYLAAITRRGLAEKGVPGHG